MAGVLLLSGRLAALQTKSIVAAFPLMVLMIFMAASLLKSLRNERRQTELHDALLRERIQRMLEEYEADQADRQTGDAKAPDD